MNWHDYFLNLAMTTAQKSKDPSTKVGAIVVAPNNAIISMGFNGFPRKVPDDEKMLRDRATKLKLVLHAESNAIDFARQRLDDCSIYTWPLPPCAGCAARIAQVGIVKVVTCKPTGEQTMRWGEDWELAAWVYNHAGIELIYHW